MSASDEEEQCGVAFLVMLLKEYPVLLNKGKTPELRAKKAEAVKACVAEYAANGELQTPENISRKIANLEQRVKKKTDTTATGNKKVRLLQHERIFLELVKADTNPKFSQVPGGRTVGFSAADAPCSSSESTASCSLGYKNGSEMTPTRDAKVARTSVRANRKRSCALLEASSKMSKEDLQRAVLEEQLQCFREMRKYYEAKNARLTSSSSSTMESPL